MRCERTHITFDFHLYLRYPSKCILGSNFKGLVEKDTLASAMRKLSKPSLLLQKAISGLPNPSPWVYAPL